MRSLNAFQLPRYRTGTRWLAIGCLGLLMMAGSRPATAQEFNCRVSVNYQNLTGSDFSFLQDLQQAVSEYLNQRSWTEDRFLDHERIDCSFSIFFQEAVSLSSFRARLVIALSRPIYGTSGQTNVVQISDENWRFDYTRGTPLIHDIDRFDPLTSVLDFYAYLLLGYDYDTFSSLGGTKYFQQARLIAELARSSGAPGWTQLGGDRSRGELISQIQDPRFQPLRQVYFDYHFNGLDLFTSDPDRARANILGVLETLREINRDVSRAYVLDLFFSTKFQELAAVFEGSSLRTQAYDLLAELDPSHLNEYNKLVQ
ncbi:DUF4835 family protein [Rhodocaloribacter litoris]|uniref:type IX secretion system protein PorD n=1 Tax=Rhodocaloribacter litoris TaxID=2558931 RepID=UPI00141DB302|nr:DUF4835 family protein [Rhodocaloribacter litoris]QXD14760.1 DUF4835 family protein [Rhodocaloribacter litoris]GIV59154.1 MAG: DUF4835 domain-containing protein [Rhodothermaceae bacterium]